jgi:ABC-2 type transport system permease protein
MNLRSVLWIFRNELRRILKDRAFLILGLGLPVIIIVLVGSTFGTAGTVRLGLVDHDGSPRAAALIERLDGVRGVDLEIRHSERVMRRDVRSTALGAGVVLPAGYGKAVDAGAGNVEVIADLSSSVVATALAAIDAAVAAEGVDEAAVQLVATGDGDDGTARAKVAAAAAELTPVVVRSTGATADKTGEEDDEPLGAFSYTAPANLVLFVFITTFAVSTQLANDRKTGLIARMLSTPNSPSSILLGLGGSKLAFAIVQSFLVLGIGRILFGVQWGDPVAGLVLIVLFAAVATAVGLIVGARVQNADQAQSIGIPVAVAMGMLGGCMWPLEIVPGPMRTAGHLVPHAWAMDAWRKLIFDGAGLRDIAPQLGVLLGIVVVLAPIAARTLRRSITG